MPPSEAEIFKRDGIPIVSGLLNVYNKRENTVGDTIGSFLGRPLRRSYE